MKPKAIEKFVKDSFRDMTYSKKMEFLRWALETLIPKGVEPVADDSLTMQRPAGSMEK